MKKVCLAGFWIAQYVLGIAGIVALHMNSPFLALPLLVASYFSTTIGGKLVGIGSACEDEANEQIPGLVKIIWRLVGVLLFTMIVSIELQGTRIGTTMGLPAIPLTKVHVLTLLYVAATFRDFFLIRFYFSRDL